MHLLGAHVSDLSVELARALDGVTMPGALAYALGLDSPARPPGGSVLLDQPRGRVAMLAGPDVLTFRAVDGLREFAVAAHVGVANTWGAKGVFPWDSPHHLGTCGLQADDFPLLGFADLDVLWVTGIDEAESPRARIELGARIEVIDPRDLAPLASHVARSPHPIETPPLFARLAAVAQPGYVDDRHPRHPARAVMDLKRSLAPGALVVAEPGPTGLWIARTFPTDGPGTVVVPATSTPGVAAASALAAAAHGIPTALVALAPADATVAEASTVADRHDFPFTVHEWGDDVDLSLTQVLVEAAGPVVAWPG
ncbi:MAG: hypothetical protein FJW88_02980 [Actinobacteria bacterium]|nr:hypothetical protein [Actinomycetota bacterium]